MPPCLAFCGCWGPKLRSSTEPSFQLLPPFLEHWNGRQVPPCSTLHVADSYLGLSKCKVPPVRRLNLTVTYRGDALIDVSSCFVCARVSIPGSHRTQEWQAFSLFLGKGAVVVSSAGFRASFSKVIPSWQAFITWEKSALLGKDFYVLELQERGKRII